MNILDALKNKTIHDLRLSHGNRWLYWDGKKFIVQEYKPYQRHSTIVAETENEEDAVSALLEDISGNETEDDF